MADLQAEAANLRRADVNVIRAGEVRILGAAQEAALTYVVTGLKNGVKYQFNLNAINIAGKMSDAASADATPEVRRESVECGVD